MTKSYRIEWAPLAIQDVDEILAFITAREDLDTATRVCDRILARVRSLSGHPNRCRIVPELRDFGIREYREAIARPYRIIFRIVGSKVGIIGVLDSRRDLEELLLDRALNPEDLFYTTRRRSR